MPWPQPDSSGSGVPPKTTKRQTEWCDSDYDSTAYSKSGDAPPFDYIAMSYPRCVSPLAFPRCSAECGRFLMCRRRVLTIWEECKMTKVIVL